jgi:hypothetical protein
MIFLSPDTNARPYIFSMEEDFRTSKQQAKSKIDAIKGMVIFSLSINSGKIICKQCVCSERFIYKACEARKYGVYYS